MSNQDPFHGLESVGQWSARQPRVVQLLISMPLFGDRLFLPLFRYFLD